jgi:dihydroorotase
MNMRSNRSKIFSSWVTAIDRCRLISQDDTRTIGERARNRNALRLAPPTALRERHPCADPPPDSPGDRSPASAPRLVPVEVANANRDVVVGIKVRVGRHASGTSGIVPLEIALEVADEVGLPVMAHIDHPPPSYEEVIARLRPGDILTHAFRPFPNAPIGPQGTVKREVLEARGRGVRFDIGHGRGSFAFKTARAMLAGGFLPDTISSDVHALCINGPAFDLITTMSKFVCLGLPLAGVIAASTVNAAMALKRPELGSLKPGSAGDATILALREGSFDYVDVVGEHMAGDRKIVSEGVVLGGRWWHPQPSSRRLTAASEQ